MAHQAKYYGHEQGYRTCFSGLSLGICVAKGDGGRCPCTCQKRSRHCRYESTQYVFRLSVCEDWVKKTSRGTSVVDCRYETYYVG